MIGQRLSAVEEPRAPDVRPMAASTNDRAYKDGLLLQLAESQKYISGLGLALDDDCMKRLRKV